MTVEEMVVKISVDVGDGERKVYLLNKSIDGLKTEADKLKTVYADAAKKYGENSKEAKKLAAQLEINKGKEADLTAQVNKASAALLRQGKEFNQSAQSAAGFKEQVSQLGNMLKLIMTGYAGKKLFDLTIINSAEMEQTLTSFEVLLNSAAKAQAMMEELEAFAAKTPLTLPDVTDAAQLLLGYGVAAKDVIDIMGRLGDLSQGNAEKMSRVSLAYGQMLAKGKVTGEELRQMVEAQVPLLQGLADYMKTSTAEIQDMIGSGALGIEELNGAIKMMTDEGGQFFGMMEKQSQTMLGMWSSLTDNIVISAREVGAEAFEYLKDELAAFGDALSAMREDGSLSIMARDIGSALATAIKAIGGFVKVLWEMRTAILAVVGAWAIHKTAVTINNIITKTTMAYKGFVSVLGLLKQTITAGTMAQTLSNLKTGEEILLRNTATGAITLQTAAEAANMLATEGATYAQISYNAALMANPIGIVTAALGALTIGLIAFARGTKGASAEAAGLAEAFGNEIEAIEQAKETINSENATRDELVRAISAVNSEYEKEISQIEDVNRLRQRGIELLDEEAKQAARKYLRDNQREIEEARKYLEQDPIQFQTRISDTPPSYYGTTDADNLKDYYLERIEIIDRLNEKVAQGTRLTKDEQKELDNAQYVYGILRDKMEKSIPVYDEAAASWGILNNTLADTAVAADSASAGMEKVKLAGSELIAALASTEEKVGALSGALSEFDKNGSVSSKTLQELGKTFGNLKGFQDFQNALIDSGATMKDVENAANSLANEYLASTGIMSSLTLENRELIASQLEAMGIANAQVLVMDSLVASTLSLGKVTDETADRLMDEASAAGYTKSELDSLRMVLELARLGNLDLANATVESIAQLIHEGQASEETGKMIQWYAYQCQIASATVIDTSASIQNLASLVDAINGTSEAFAAFLSLSALQGASASEIMERGELDTWQATVKSAQDRLSRAINNVSFSGGSAKPAVVSYAPASSSSSGSRGGSSAGQSSATDNSEREAEQQRKQQVKDYENYVDEIIRLDERWNKRQREFGNLSDEAFLWNLGNRADTYRRFADEVLKQDYMTEEEKQTLRKQYLEAAEDIDLEYFKFHKDMQAKAATAEQKANNERLDSSKDWIARQKALGKMSADEEIAAGRRVIQQALDNIAAIENDERLSLEEKEELKKKWWNVVVEYSDREVDIEREKLNKIYELNRENTDKLLALHQDRVSNSQSWVSEQLDRDLMSPAGEIAAYDRMIEQLLKETAEGEAAYNQLISELKAQRQRARDKGHSEDSEEMEKLNKQIAEAEREKQRYLDEQSWAHSDLQTKRYKTYKAFLEKEVQDYIEAEREKVNAHYKAIKEMQAQDDRDQRRKDLEEQIKQYENAETKEGKEKLKQLKKELAALDKEEANIALDKEQEKALSDLDELEKGLMEEAKNTAIKIIPGAIEGVTEAATKAATESMNELLKLSETKGKKWSENLTTPLSDFFTNVLPKLIQAAIDSIDVSNISAAVGSLESPSYAGMAADYRRDYSKNVTYQVEIHAKSMADVMAALGGYGI